MTPAQYCTAKAAAPGSTLHYALRYAPEDRRATLTALFALTRELTQLTEDRVEPHIAQTRLAWWREEIANAFAERPTHPVTTALAPTLAQFNLQPALFEELLDGAAMALEHDTYPAFSALALYCYRSSGAALLLACEVLGYDARKTPKFAHELGTALRLTQLLRDLGWHLQHGRLFIPLDEVTSHGLDLDDLRPHPPARDQITALLVQQSTRAETHYQNALALLEAEDRAAQRCLVVLAALRRALLAELKHAGPALLQQRISLTPLRKLWIAWHAARRGA
ncbi:MAG: squalene/phytoene synthase family protein [Thiotrichales bacterium]